MTQASPAIVFPSARRLARRRVGAAAVCLGFLLAVAYAALPLWLPTSWLSRQITEQLTQALHRPVRIGRLHVGWIRGVVLDDIRISERPGGSNQDLARISQIRVPFQPLRTLLGWKLDEIEIKQPQLWLVLGPDGQVQNIPDLGQKRGGTLPSLRYTVRDALCHLIAPERTEIVRIDQLQCELEPRTGLLCLFGSTVLHRLDPKPPLAPIGRFSLDAHVTVTRLRRDRTLGGTVTLEWRDLALTDLPLAVAARVPFRQVDGATSGRVTLAPKPDLGVDFDLFIELNGVRIQRADLDRPSVVPDAIVQTAGHWDPSAEIIVLHQFDYDTPAVHIARVGDKPALRIDRGGDAAFQMQLAGQVKDWEALRREFPEVDEFADALGVQTAGSARFSVTLDQRRKQDRLILDVDGTGSEWVMTGRPAPYLSAPAGIPKSLHMDVVQTRPGELARLPRTSLWRPQIRVAVGDLALTTGGAIVMPSPEPADKLDWLAQALPQLQWSIDFRTGHLDEATTFMPWLDRLGFGDAAGPATATLSVTPEQNHSRFEISLHAPEETSFRIGDGIAKPTGLPLHLKAGALLSHDQFGRIASPYLQAECGQSKVTLDPHGSRLDCRFRYLSPPSGDAADASGRPVAIEATAELPLRISEVEDLLKLCPAAVARESFEGSGVPAARGSLNLALRSRLSYRPGDLLVSSNLEFGADDLALSWGDLLDKPAGRPASLNLAHRWQHLDGRSEQSIDARLTAPGARLDTSVAFGAGSPFERATLQARIDNIPALLAILPALARQLQAYEPSGKLQLAATDLALDGRHRVSLSLDATDAGCILPGETPIPKPAGAPAALAMQWQADPLDAQGRQTWTLLEATARSPGLDLNTATGQAIVAWSSSLSPAQRVWQHDYSRPALQSAQLQAAGTLRFDPVLAAIDARIGDIYDRLKLTGDCGFALQLAARPGAVDVRGRIDAERTRLAVDLEPGAAIASIQKPLGLPAAVDFDLGFSRAPQTDAAALQSDPDYSLDVRQLALGIAGNIFTATGQVQLAGTPDALRPSSVDVIAAFDMTHPGALAAMLPESPLKPASGAAAGKAHVTATGDQLRLESAELQFAAFSIGTPANAIGLDGQLALTRDEVVTDALTWTWGPSRGSVSGSVQHDASANTGRLAVTIDQLDTIDLTQRLEKCRSATAATATPAAGEAGRGLSNFLDQLARTEMVVEAHAGKVRVSLPLDVQVLFEAMSASATAGKGPLASEFRCIVDGGAVTGSYAIRADQPDAPYHLAYTAERIQPGRLVDAYLKLTFPGMKATGPLTLIDASDGVLTGPRASEWPVGIGEMIIDGGSVEGRAAPEWVTRIFPGLNLSRFDFSYMHSWFEKFPDGRIRHQMIYRGTFYNVYMIGFSDNVTGKIDYEVGIDFFARFDSKYWADTGSGRIPLFTKTGRKLPDGSLADEVVTYSNPVRVMQAIFVKNNPVYTAYHAVRKRVLKQK